MTLRARMSAIAAAAVALAVVAVAVTAWLLTRQTLLDEVDRQLMEQTSTSVSAVSVNGDSGETPLYPIAGEAEAGASSITREVAMVQAVPMSSLTINSGGGVTDVFPPVNTYVPVVDASIELLDRSGADAELSSYTDPGTGGDFRVVSIPTPEGGVFQVARSLEDVNETLGRLGLLLTAGAIAGVLIAGLAGWWVSRAGLRPVDHLTAAAEQVADSRDLSHRISVNGRDEIARLGESINKMLGELDTARHQQRQLVQDAGHELRTPLATLRNDVGLLVRAERADHGLDSADKDELLASVESEVAALSVLVTEVVDLAQGEVDEESFETVDVRVIAESAVERTRRVNPQVEVTVSGAVAFASVRPTTLERALSNLVRNALQVTPAGGNVEVLVTHSSDSVVVHICDEGPGIPRADLPRIFDRFYRGDNSRERQGSGLGLAIVRQAVEQHGGTVQAANRMGKGARLTVRLPR